LVQQDRTSQDNTGQVAQIRENKTYEQKFGGETSWLVIAKKTGNRTAQY